MRPKLRRVTLRECHIHIHRSRLHYHTWNTPSGESFCVSNEFIVNDNGYGRRGGTRLYKQMGLLFRLDCAHTLPHTQTHTPHPKWHNCVIWIESGSESNHGTSTIIFGKHTHKQQLPCLHIQPCVPAYSSDYNKRPAYSSPKCRCCQYTTAHIPHI